MKQGVFLFLLIIGSVLIAAYIGAIYQNQKEPKEIVINNDTLLVDELLNPPKNPTQTSCSFWRELYDPFWNKDNTILIRICKHAKLGYVMEYIDILDLQKPVDPDFSKLLIKKTVNGKTMYIDEDNQEQYFVVEKNGNLSAYDNYGYIETYKKY